MFRNVVSVDEETLFDWPTPIDTVGCSGSGKEPLPTDRCRGEDRADETSVADDVETVLYFAGWYVRPSRAIMIRLGRLQVDEDWFWCRGVEGTRGWSCRRHGRSTVRTQFSHFLKSRGRNFICEDPSLSSLL